MEYGHVGASHVTQAKQLKSASRSQLALSSLVNCTTLLHSLHYYGCIRLQVLII
jgi:hypothetical protein